MKRKTRWDIPSMPDQGGKTAVVTGANSGLGYQISKALAKKGARVIMACRDTNKGREALELILSEHPAQVPEVMKLDLADLTSVKSFASELRSRMDKLDLLINNAGLMAIPYNRTKDGFEMQFGVNHLGHFALTAALWPLIRQTSASRIITVSSAAHHIGKIRTWDIHWEQSYKRWGAYGMSKLSNLLFTKELSERITRSGIEVIAAAAHPGYASTELQAKGARMEGARWKARFFNMANGLFAQSAEMGALPVLYAATAEGVDQGSYFGPGGFLRMTGWPAPDTPNRRKLNNGMAKNLWEISEQLTGVTFTL